MVGAAPKPAGTSSVKVAVRDLSVSARESANGVLLSARYTFFERIENAIRACELEGVEACICCASSKTA